MSGSIGKVGDRAHEGVTLGVSQNNPSNPSLSAATRQPGRSAHIPLNPRAPSFVSSSALRPMGPHPQVAIIEAIDDVLSVGKSKLLGYIPLENITRTRVSVQKVISELEQMVGRKTILFERNICPALKDGALFCYDAPRLQKYLEIPENKATLARHGWPEEADMFVRHSAYVDATTDDLKELIALAYNDPRPQYRAKMFDLKALS